MIRIIHGGMGSGKTHQLILEASKVGAVIFCRSEQDVKRIMRMAKDMKVNIPQPMTFEDFKRGQQSWLAGVRKPIFIDGALDLLQSYSSMQIDMVTTEGALKWIKVEDNLAIDKAYLEQLKRNINFDDRQRLLYANWDYTEADKIFEYACILFAMEYKFDYCYYEKIHHIVKEWFRETKNPIDIKKFNVQLNKLKHSHEYKPEDIIRQGKANKDYETILGYVRFKMQPPPEPDLRFNTND